MPGNFPPTKPWPDEDSSKKKEEKKKEQQKEVKKEEQQKEVKKEEQQKEDEKKSKIFKVGDVVEVNPIASQSKSKVGRKIENNNEGPEAKIHNKIQNSQEMHNLHEYILNLIESSDIGVTGFKVMVTLNKD